MTIRPGIRGLFTLQLWRRQDAARDVRDETELHIALRAEQLARQGMPPAEAEEAARRYFALSQQTIDDLTETALARNHHMQLRERWDGFWQDTRYAARRL